MLSETQILKARKSVEKLYTGSCTIFEQNKYTRANKSTGTREQAVLKDQPCRLSHSGSSSAGQTDSASGVEQPIRVFLSPEIDVKPGSKLVITQDGVTEAYKNSGKPAVFRTHQEIELELFKEWA